MVNELLTILNPKDKHAIFRQAYLTSNQLIAWNVPVRLNSISDQQLKREAQERLFKHNLLDGLLFEYLEDSAWLKREYEKLTDQQCQKIAQATAQQYLFITKLEKDAGKQGELKKILKEYENKDMKELRSKWEVDAEGIKDIKEWSKKIAEKVNS